MPRCLDCRRELPSFETLCSKCFEARYSEASHPPPLLRSFGRYVSNPFGVTHDSKPTMRLPGFVFCCCGGVLLCWYGGFAELGYKYALFSNAVLSAALLILAKSWCLSLGLSLFLARKNLSLYWEVALGGFLAISFCYARWAWHVGVFPSWLQGHAH